MLELVDDNQLVSLVHLDNLLMPDQAWSLALWKSSLASSSIKLLVMEDLNDQIIGFLLCDFNSYEQMAHLLKIGVLPNFQGQSLGSQLLKRMEQMATESNLTKLFLEVEVENKVAYQAYLNNGYQVLRRAPRFYSNGADAYIMLKVLHAY
jgi:ribosomal protein S18 acetylase RimI-like enzyme